MKDPESIHVKNKRHWNYHSLCETEAVMRLEGGVYM